MKRPHQINFLPERLKVGQSPWLSLIRYPSRLISTGYLGLLPGAALQSGQKENSYPIISFGIMLFIFMILPGLTVQDETENPDTLAFLLSQTICSSSR